jgi:uncharacterized protein YwgA
MISDKGELMLLKKELPYLSDQMMRNSVVFQKTVYLLQATGLEFGYRFKWYLKGPYSPELADDIDEAFACQKYYEEEAEDYEFQPEVKEKIKKFQDILGDRKEDAEWLELIVSLHFLAVHYPDKKPQQMLIDRKPKYKEMIPVVEAGMQFLEDNKDIFFTT